MADKIMKTLNGYEIYDEFSRNKINELSEQKVDKSYVIELFEELKRLIQEGQSAAAIAVLDNAILDLSKLA